MKNTTTLCAYLTMLTFAGVSHAATLAYWRMGDDTDKLQDSSGNGNHLGANTGTQVSLPGSGDGSTFPNPIPQTGQSNTNAVDFNGSNGGDRAIIDDFFDSSSDFTIETLFNMQTANNSRDQYIVSQYDTSGNQRSWALGVADADSGNDGAGAGELFIWFSGDGNINIGGIIGLGVTITANTDYYVGLGIDNTTDTNDLSFYYQDLTNNGTLQFSPLTSDITTLHNSTADLEIAAFNVDDSNFAGLIDEVRISSGVLSQSELITIPEPSTAIYVVMTFGLLGLTGLRGRRKSR
ncbi:MAG: hypothetical protein PF795_09175 [Kiritimatiellae bacterium]|jgi:hypothetical protein|nr:hypothetical protein [Kiritimatiellia bacterium]